jgi:katanin p60 ATPase-containing subunit A1
MPIDKSPFFYGEYKKARKRAEDAERRAAFNQAASAYRQAADYMHKYAECSLEAAVRKERHANAQSLEQAAQRMLDLAAAPRTVSNSAAQPDAPTGEDDYDSRVLNLIQQTKIRWDDIGGLEKTKSAIKSAYAMALARKPVGVDIQSQRTMLLYGPPGTGKTLLAAATAGMDATFFNVETSSLLSKYFGESSKLIDALYAAARRLNPAVVFLDEFEALTPPRGGSESGPEQRIVTQFLSELDGLESKSDDSFVFTMGATNYPWQLDVAILSRFQTHIYVPLPDEHARRSILGIHLTRRGHRCKVSMDELVKRTDGFSGREISQLCEHAVAKMTQDANPRLLEIVDQGQEAVRAYEISVQPLSEKDFTNAFELVHPVATPQLLAQYEAWSKRSAR